MTITGADGQPLRSGMSGYNEVGTSTGPGSIAWEQARAYAEDLARTSAVIQSQHDWHAARIEERRAAKRNGGDAA